MEDVQSGVCPTCSETLVCPKNMLDDEHKDLLVFLIRMLDCEVDVAKGIFKICVNCETLLKSFLGFKDLCEKSIEQFKNHGKGVNTEEIIFFVKNENLNCDDNTVENNDFDDIKLENLEKALNEKNERRRGLKRTLRSKKRTSKTAKKDCKSANKNDAQKSNKRKIKIPTPKVSHLENMRILTRYPSDAVLQAYKNTMKPFYATRQCPICYVNMRNRHRLGTHITHIHKEVQGKWCLKCNTIENNLSEHDEVHHAVKRLFTCPFCKRGLSSAPEMRLHLERHSATRLNLKHKGEWSICEHCPAIFQDEDELNDHQCSNKPTLNVDNATQQEQPENTEIQNDATESTGLKSLDRRKIRKHLDRFPHEEVDKILRKTMTLFYTNRKCPFCGLLTSNLNLLSKHVLAIHKDVRDNWCSKCNASVDHLRSHEETHPEDFFVCPFCQSQFSDRYKFKVHLMYHSESPLTKLRTDWFICKKCPQSFPYIEQLKEHQREGPCSINDDDENDEEPKKAAIKSCPFCKAQVRFLSMHIKKVHIYSGKSKKDESGGSKTMTKKGQDCGEKSDQIAIKDIYVKEKTKNKRPGRIGRPKGDRTDMNLCNYCGYIAKTTTRLRNHMHIHTGEKPFKCSICGKALRTSESRREHELRHEGERRYPCDICGKMYNSRNEVRMHKRMHETQPQICYICNKKFCRPQLLKLHMKRHTDADKFACNQCDSKFHINRLLTRHIIDAHTTDRPYKCSFCEKDFKHVEHLNSHERIHKNIKPYSCSVCTFRTSTTWSLSLHMRKHPEDAPQANNPHKCDLCFKSYSTNAMLMSHTRNVHNQNVAQQKVEVESTQGFDEHGVKWEF